MNSEIEMVSALMNVLEAAPEVEGMIEVLDDAGEALVGADCRTFEQGGVLTMNQGFTIRLSNGAEFQITVVQSREARG